MTKRQGVQAVAFLVLLAMVLGAFNQITTFPKTDKTILMSRRFQELYEEPKDIWDGVVIGTSVVDRSWSAPAAWEKYGMAVYPMATDSQPFVLIPNLLEEIRRQQDITFAAVELHGIRSSVLSTSDSRIRWVASHMKPSLNQLRTKAKALDYMKTWYPENMDLTLLGQLSIYFPLIKFHDRVTSDAEINAGDFDIGETKMKGVYEGSRRVATREIRIYPLDQPGELNELQKLLLDELIAYAEETDLQLIFYLTPSQMSREARGELNAAKRYLQERGFEVLDFHEKEIWKAAGITRKTDYIDKVHMNPQGSLHFTEYFASCLKEKVQMPDHRGEAGYESWDEAVDAYHEFYDGVMQEMEEWLEQKNNSVT